MYITGLPIEHRVLLYSHCSQDSLYLLKEKRRLLMSNVAILIPCYNESKTIERVIKDYRKVLPDADMTIILLMERTKLPVMLVPLFAMNVVREKET